MLQTSKHMKAIYSLMLLLICSSFAASIDYPVAHLYAYKQKVSSGANTTVNKLNKQATLEYVYLTVKQNRTIKIDHVWINGIAVNFKTEEVKSPVTIEAGVSLSGKPAALQLVPETACAVVQVLIDDKNAPVVKSIPKRYKKYALLLQYKEGTSIFFLGKQKWDNLASKANQ